MILLDVQMPELDGFQVIQAVGLDRMPAVVFVTAHGQFAVKAFEASAVDYLLKPFDRVRLKEALRRVRSASGAGARCKTIDDLIGLLGSTKDRPRHQLLERVEKPG